MEFPKSQAPDDDTLEISLFGTGVGEAIAVHLGNGEWALIDSCKGNTDVPLNLGYLESLGIDIENQVKLVIATHWHDDHVKGLSQIYKKCLNAQLVLSNALERDEFKQLVTMYAANSTYIVDKETSGVSEMGKILTILRERKQAKGKTNYLPPMRAAADMLLFKGQKCQLFTISPSHHAVDLAAEEMANLFQEITSNLARGTVPRPERNHYAIALWFSWGTKKVLLGSDLEECGDPKLGWQAALNAKVFPDGSASIVKIAHHGSPNGDHEDIWNKIVIPSDPIAILTAYSPGVTGRPSIADIQRIKTKTSNVYFTTLPKQAANKYLPKIEKTIAGTVRNRKILKKNPGHIRVRWDSNDVKTVEVFGAAGVA